MWRSICDKRWSLLLDAERSCWSRLPSDGKVCWHMDPLSGSFKRCRRSRARPQRAVRLEGGRSGFPGGVFSPAEHGLRPVETIRSDLVPRIGINRWRQRQRRGHETPEPEKLHGGKELSSMFQVISIESCFREGCRQTDLFRPLLLSSFTFQNLFAYSWVSNTPYMPAISRS